MAKFLPLSLAALATATLLAGTAVLAQPSPDRSMSRADAQTRAAEAFQRLDVNGDGQLGPDDREAATRQHFDAADTDNNGQLSFAEANAMHEQRREMREERRDGRGERMGMASGMRGHGPMGGGAMGAGPMGGRMLEGADADNNGTVSQAEFTSAALARFDRADADSDGTITPDEHRAVQGERHGEHRRTAPR